MRYNLTENLGVLESGILFTKEINWIFRQQPLVDVGIDALIEESIEGNPTGKFIAAQIKSGIGNFHATSTSFIYYISHVHKFYWLNLDIPIILIAHIPSTSSTYWEHINRANVKSTKTQWKIEVPFHKKLNLGSKIQLEKIIKSDNNYNFLQKLISGKVDESEISRILSSTKCIEDLTQTSYKIVAIMKSLNVGIQKQTIQINQLAVKRVDKNDRKLKFVVKKTAALINQSSKELDSSIRNFGQQFAESFGAFEKLASIEFYQTKNYQVLEQTYDIMHEILIEINNTSLEITKMRNEVSALPQIFNNLNKARINMINSCNNLLSEYKASKMMAKNLCNRLFDTIHE